MEWSLQVNKKLFTQVFTDESGFFGGMTTPYPQGTTDECRNDVKCMLWPLQLRNLNPFENLECRFREHSSTVPSLWTPAHHILGIPKTFDVKVEAHNPHRQHTRTSRPTSEPKLVNTLVAERTNSHSYTPKSLATLFRRVEVIKTAKRLFKKRMWVWWSNVHIHLSSLELIICISCLNSIHLFTFCDVKDSSSVVEWTQRPLRPLDQQLSYETEWDMVNTVSFKKKVHTNGEGKNIFLFFCKAWRKCKHKLSAVWILKGILLHYPQCWFVLCSSTNAYLWRGPKCVTD